MQRLPNFYQVTPSTSAHPSLYQATVCSALCVALFAPGYTKVFLRAESRGWCGKSEPGEHFVDSKLPGLLIGSLSPLSNGAEWDEQPRLAAAGWIKVLTAFLPWAASLLTATVIRSSLMEPLLVCSRSTLLPQPVLTTSEEGIIWAQQKLYRGALAGSNLGKEPTEAGRSPAKLSSKKRKNTFYHKRYATQKLSYPSCVRQRNWICSCQFFFEVFPTNSLHPCTAINKWRNTIHYVRYHARVPSQVL